MNIIKKYLFACKTGLGFLLFSALISSTYADTSVDDYLDLPLADLLSIEVTSVSKKKQHLNEVAAAIFVITQEDIKRSGVTTIPEALRLAPGIQVARLDGTKWVITSRGFANLFSNKLLVMIDGRSVYTPAYSGVYWDVQDTMLEDIERIEVIRGPGATVWGANAVNGVINIITKQSEDTQGGLLVAGAGNEEKSFAHLRYGDQIDNNTYGRFYLKFNDRDSLLDAEKNEDSDDAWRTVRGGFRVDGQQSAVDSWTLQGDIYRADENQRINEWKDPLNPDNASFAPTFLEIGVSDSVESSGINLLGRWTHEWSSDSSSSLQFYYDQAKRSETFLTQQHDTFDIDFQHQTKMFSNHEVIWGLAYRRINDNFTNSFNASILPEQGQHDIYSAFLQDEIELSPNALRLTLGSKFEYNDYTGSEIQPSVRLAWLPTDRSTAWLSVSRAVRTPSRVEDGSQIIARITSILSTPIVINAVGSDKFKSETLIAYEAGYRIQAKENISFDLSTFYNEYDNLQSFEPLAITPPTGSLVFNNELAANSYGAELSMDWRPMEWWRLQANYSYLNVSNVNDTLSILVEDSSPEHQFSVRSLMDLNNNMALDLWVYYVSELANTNNSAPTVIPAYTSFNARFSWKPEKNVELSLVGQNLFEAEHIEFKSENLLTPTEIQRSIYAQVRWDF